MSNAGHEDGCAALQGVHLKCTCGIGTIGGVAGDAACTECGRDNRHGTHDALQSFGHLAHDYSPPRDDTMDLADALAESGEQKSPLAAFIDSHVERGVTNAFAASHQGEAPDFSIRVKSLSEMAEEVYNFEVSKGWQPNANTFGDSLALLHSEISEALEAFREIGFSKRDRVMCDGNHADGTGHSPNIKLESCPLPKPDDVPSELIDVYIRLLSTWHQFMAPLGFRLESEYERKMAYNRTRPQRHGGKAL